MAITTARHQSLREPKRTTGIMAIMETAVITETMAIMVTTGTMATMATTAIMETINDELPKMK
jgi:hypothetical protein